MSTLTARPSGLQSDAGPRGRGRPAGRKTGDGLLADREALLAAAERVICEQGPTVSLDVIAAEAGVTKPILYRGVGGRDALIQALSQRLTARMAQRATKLAVGAAGPEDSLLRLARAYLSQADRERNLYLYVTAAVAGNDPMRQSLVLADTTATGFVDTIAANRAKYGADPSVAKVWAYALVGALHYVTLLRLRDRSVGIERAARHLTAMLWSGFDLGSPHKVESARRVETPRSAKAQAKTNAKPRRTG